MGHSSQSDCDPKKAHIHFIDNASGTRLALWHHPSVEGMSKVGGSAGREGAQLAPSPVILSHGTFSNHRSCRGLAQYLAKRGFDCWILDFQGHGQSETPENEPDFESMCLEDVDAALSFVMTRHPGVPIDWVGHSGGGLAMLMHLARNPNVQSQIGKLVTLASQATHAGLVTKNRLGIQASKIITRALGVAPGRWFKIGPENEFSKVMLQWYQWSLEGRWLGADGFDYEKALGDIDTPLLSFAGGGDKFIAPVEGCRYLFDCVGSTTKEFEFCAADKGYKEDYSHARIISSSSAAKDIWPKVADWLQSSR